MKKNDIPINEFLADPEFVRWVREPDPELEAYWLNWMDANSDKRAEMQMAREIIQGLQFDQKLPDPSLKQAVLANILSDSHAGNSGKGDLSSKTVLHKAFLWDRLDQAAKVAAILLFTLSLSVLINFLNEAPVRPESVATVNIISRTTDHGEKLNFKLPDGTLVWLNAGSELHYPEKFDSLERMVRLRGEAFFEVEKGNNWPFSVVSGNLTTTALGTSFNIKNGGDGILSISLVTGKVKVENELTHENILLLPGQQLNYSEESKKTVIGPFEENRTIGWKSGLLQFTNASFEEVREALEKWYGVTIHLSGKPSRTWKLTGAYQAENLELVLKRIAYIQQLEYTIDDKNVRIKFK